MFRACQTLFHKHFSRATHVIAFIDQAIDNHQMIASGIAPNVEVVVLDSRQDGMRQIVDTLAARTDVAAVHIFSHGAPGHLYLGNSQLNSTTLDHYAQSPNLFAAFSQVDLFLYGCNVAEGGVGRRFLEKLHRLTGVGVLASTTRIGSHALGGNWDLDARIGSIAPQSVLHPEVMESYEGVFGTVTVTNAADSGTGSLRAAIASASSGDTIVFAAGITNIALSSQIVIDISKSLTIDGGSQVTISGSGSNRLFAAGDFSNLAIKNLNLNNGYATATAGSLDAGFKGGAIFASYKVNLTVDNVTFNGNVADKGGGAIYVGYDSTLSVNNSRFNNNLAIAGNDERGAGAIATVTPGAVTITNSDFIGNRGINGGAINTINAKLTIENSRFINNDVLAAQFASGQPNDFLRGYGGAIYTDRANDTTTILNSVFEGNQARASGGAVHLFSDPEDVVTIDGSLFRNNQAIGLSGGEAGGGGAITHIRNSLGSGNFTLTNTSVIDNFAAAAGGGLSINNANSFISNSTFAGNKASPNANPNVSEYVRNGGAILLFAPAQITNTTIVNNQAGWAGGAIAAGDGYAVSLRNSILVNNQAFNPYNIANSTSRLLTDNGGNFQWPPKATNFGNDNNATASITLQDPLLGTQQQTGNAVFYPLLSGSPAINQGVAGAPTQDVRGATRDAQPDPGSYEFDGLIPSNTIAIQGASLVEGNSGTSNLVFTVSLAQAATQQISVNYTSANGTATAGSDYTAVSGTLTFNVGETSKTISVPILGDTLVEPNETFSLSLSNPTNATLGTSQGVGTITNDDISANNTLSIQNSSLTEGNSGSSNMTFTVNLAQAATQLTTVDFATANGTATAGSDYTAVSGTLTFNVGETSKTISVPILGDTLVETNETFSINLGNPTNATLGTSQAVGTITNDDIPPVNTLSIQNVNLVEGNSGSSNLVFTVSLAQAATQQISVDYTSADGSATAGSDYTAVSGTLTFNVGETSKTISVPISGDTVVEPNETFSITLSNPTNATLGNTQGTGTITNDDIPTGGTNILTIQDASLVEGNSGSSTMTFTVSLAQAATQATTVDFATADGSATAGSDYTAVSGSLTFNVGETSKTINVAIAGDTLVEPNETFSINLSNPTNATLANTQGTGTITNDDIPSGGGTNTLSIQNASLVEGNSGSKNLSFTVSLAQAAAQQITVDYASINGSATAGSDYTTVAGTLTFNVGETSKTITVPISGDMLFETNETFTLNLSNPTNATLGTSQAVGTIVNDDSPTGGGTNGSKCEIVWRNYTTGANLIWVVGGTTVTQVLTLPSIPDLNWQIQGNKDFNGDGNTDLVWRNQATGQNLLWLMNGANISQLVELPSVLDLNWKIQAIADFDHNGSQDLVWRNQATGQNLIWLMNGNSISQLAELPTIADLNWQIQGSGDFDGDDNQDLVWRNGATGENLVWKMNGTAVNGAASLLPINDLNWQVQASGDFNGDGRTDLFWQNKVTGAYRFSILDGTLNTNGGTKLDSVLDPNWQIQATGDFNGDGKVDLVWRNQASGETILWSMNNTTVTGLVKLTTIADSNWQVQATGDFNSDGKTDLVWRNQASGENLLWLMDNANVSQMVNLPAIADSNWQIQATGDFNGDGKTDLVWRNQASGENLLWLMNNSTVTNFVSLPTIVDSNWQIQATGDFNSDGKTDLVWRNQANGENLLWLMNNSTMSQMVNLSTIPDPNWQVQGSGDFNGDGQADLVWRNNSNGANGVWFMKSITQTQINESNALGKVDLPVVADTSWKGIG